MLNHVAKPFTKLVERYLPDPFIFVILLTFLSFIVAGIFTPSTPIQILTAWGSGFWNLLQFAMQMLLVLLTGYMLASTPVMRHLLTKLAACQGNYTGYVRFIISKLAQLGLWFSNRSFVCKSDCQTSSR